MEHLGPNPANSSSLTPITFLHRAATVYPTSPSLIHTTTTKTTTFTWSQTHRRCLQLASSLTTLGITRRDVVSVLAPNIPATYELHFAVPMSGAILNSINTRLNPTIISLILHHSESKLIFVDHLSFPLLQQAISLLPTNHPPPLIILILDDHRKNYQKTPDNNIIHSTYAEMIEKGDPDFDWIRPERDWDPIVLNYTSGTTSAPKGVVHSHRGAFLNAINSIIDWWVPERPVYLWTLPMFHANGWGYTWSMAAVGGTNVCLRKFDGGAVYDAIDRHRVTHLCGAPVVLNMLSSYPNPPKLPGPVHVLTAGAPPPATVLRRTESLGFVVSHGYGLTETGGLFISCAWKQEWDKYPAEDRARFKARQGILTVAGTGFDVIEPETGKSVNRDGKEVGEVVLKGGMLMLGYFKDQKGTKKCMGDDGWFRTGDVGVMHPDGYLEIKDRSKDIIISGGENISSVEVESILYTISGVNEVAVVARPDEYWGEIPCAFLSLKEDMKTKMNEKDVIEYCRAKLPHYMVPKTVVFKDELPKTSTGKIKKFVLREMAKELGPLKSSRL